jgi:probable rRNA maturation factor
MLDKDVPQIQFHFQHKGDLKNRRKLKTFLGSIFKKERYRLKSLHFIFCSDRALLAINQEFLGHDYYTDIITFNLSSNSKIEAEIYISLDRVRENARNLDQPLYVELHRVVFHGVLHLCGYRDKTRKEIQLMREKESKYLSDYFR